jgi:Spy/CpxP family protein refolding chaperone
MRMNRDRFAKRLVVAAGLFFLCAAPGLARLQSSPLGPAQPPPMATLSARPNRDTPPTDDFAGLKYTDDQKAKIYKIHQDMKVRTDAVKEARLSPEQRDAMLAGYDRMERSQVFKVLTPEQQKEVLERVRARKVAEQEEQKKQQPPPSPNLK